MSQISIAKALKLKNRLSGRLSSCQVEIQQYNSVLKEQQGKVDIKAKMEERQLLQDALCGIKFMLSQSNGKIQENLILLGELKSYLSFLGGISTREGVERHGYQNTEVVYFATLTKDFLDKERRKIEGSIDQLQDEVDAHNVSTKIDIPQQWLDLAS